MQDISICNNFSVSMYTIIKTLAWRSLTRSLHNHNTNEKEDILSGK